MPRVSILLPYRDAEGTFESCLRSIARQTLRDWECVLVDDGSRDRSPAIAARVAERDARFRTADAGGRGLVSALAAGLARCDGGFVARMDADDLMHRRRLAEQAELLDERRQWAGLGCHVRLWPRQEIGPGLRAYERWLLSIRSAEDVARDAFVECPLAHPTWMIRRCALERDGYRDRGWPEDYDLLLRLLGRGLSLGVLPRRRLAWRQSRGRLSATAPAYAIERFVACKAHHLARGPLAGSGRYTLWGYGNTGRALCAALALEERAASTIVEIHPGRIGQRIAGAPVIAPDALDRERHRPLVTAVAGADARRRIREFLGRRGWRELEDFVCAA